jgi:hypothetical protein
VRRKPYTAAAVVALLQALDADTWEQVLAELVGWGMVRRPGAFL